MTAKLPYVEAERTGRKSWFWGEPVIRLTLYRFIQTPGQQEDIGMYAAVGQTEAYGEKDADRVAREWLRSYAANTARKQKWIIYGKEPK